MTLDSWTFRGLAAGLGLTLGLAGAANAQTGQEPVRVPAAELAAKVASLKDGLVSFPVPTGPFATVLMVRRDRDGEVEVHTKLADELIAREGHAQILVGGTVAGNHQTAPNEMRGGAITGGKVYDLNPGDVIWIPIGMPHQMLVKKGASFSYMAVKFEAKGQ
jgi:mannose-6-phosphate isomerase-like protein (cupin superfamily)